MQAFIIEHNTFQTSNTPSSPKRIVSTDKLRRKMVDHQKRHRRNESAPICLNELKLTIQAVEDVAPGGNHLSSYDDIITSPDMPDDRSATQPESPASTRVPLAVYCNREYDNVSFMTRDIGRKTSMDRTHPAMQAITFQQLLDVQAEAKRLFGRNYWKKTMRDVNQDIIIPECNESGTSYALSKNPGGQKIQAFITHCWDEPFFDFVDSIEKEFHSHTKKPNLWICAFALKQGDSETLAQQLEVPLEDSPFVRALQYATWFVVVRNLNTDLYSRIWCVCELMFAMKIGFTTNNNDTSRLDFDEEDDAAANKKVTIVVGPNVFSQSQTSCVDAHAANERDKIKILADLPQSGFSVDEVDELVHSYRKYEPPNQPRKQSFLPAIGATILFFGLVAIIAWLSTQSTQTSSPTAAPTRTQAQKPGNFLDSAPNFTIDALSDASTPQYQALGWIAKSMWLVQGKQVQLFFEKEEWQQKQLFTLATFYYAYNGEQWTNSQEWLEADVPECSWTDTISQSIVCNDDKRVVELSLDSEGGSVTGNAPELSLLSSLEKIEVFGMQLHSSVEQVVPSQLSRLSDLKVVSFANNSLTGSIPSYLGEFVHLTHLNLRSNDISGEIPTEIGLMTKLESLSLADNPGITGTIPTELGSLTLLRELRLADTSVRGNISFSVCQLPHLTTLEASCGRITCCNNTTPLTTASPTTGMTYESTSAPTFSPTSGVFQPPSQPPTSPVEGLGMTPYPTSEPGSYILNLPEYTISALQDISSPQSKAYAWLEDHPNLNQLPDWRKHQLFALASLYLALNGEEWPQNEEQSWLEHNVSECLWNGFDDNNDVCDSDGRILDISISAVQNLTGSTLPPELGLLPSLESIRLYFLDGLQANLSDVLPVPLTYLPLKTLHVYATEIYGPIPSQLALFRGLSDLNLRSNKLTGTLSSELGQLTSLKSIALHQNHFVGKIPSELGLLTDLETLLLDRTDVTGAIPDELCSLPSLIVRVNCSLISNCTECTACSCYTETSSE